MDRGGEACGSQPLLMFQALFTFLQLTSLHLSFSSGYPSISVSFPHRNPFPAQPIPHWKDRNTHQRVRQWCVVCGSESESYLAGEGAVPLHVALGVDVAGVVQAAQLGLAAFHLVACES